MPRRANPAPDISEGAMKPLKDAAHDLCRSCTYETGHGTCAAACMDQHLPRDNPHGCPHALRVMAPKLKTMFTRGAVIRLNAYLKAERDACK